MPFSDPVASDIGRVVANKVPTSCCRDLDARVSFNYNYQYRLPRITCGVWCVISHCPPLWFFKVWCEAGTDTS